MYIISPIFPCNTILFGMSYYDTFTNPFSSGLWIERHFFFYWSRLTTRFSYGTVDTLQPLSFLSYSTARGTSFLLEKSQVLKRLSVYTRELHLPSFSNLLMFHCLCLQLTLTFNLPTLRNNFSCSWVSSILFNNIINLTYFVHLSTPFIHLAT